MKKSRTCLFSILIILNSLTLNAQHSKTFRKFKIQTGISYTALLDQTRSPVIYRQYSMPVSLTYYACKNDRINMINAGFDKVNMISDITDGDNHKLENIMAGFEQTLLYKLKNKFALNSQLYMGGKWKNFFSYRTNYYIAGIDNFSYDFISSLNFSAMIQHQWKTTNQLRFHISIPLVAYWNGIDYPTLPYPSGLVNKDASSIDGLLAGKIITLNRFFDVQTKFTYRHKINSYLDLTATYLFNYIWIKKTTDFHLKAGLHQVKGGVIFKL